MLMLQIYFFISCLGEHTQRYWILQDCPGIITKKPVFRCQLGPTTRLGLLALIGGRISCLTTMVLADGGSNMGRRAWVDK